MPRYPHGGAGEQGTGTGHIEGTWFSFGADCNLFELSDFSLAAVSGS